MFLFSLWQSDINSFNNLVKKVKARLVAGGDQQDKSIYTLDETSSPTVSTAAVLVTMAIAAHE